MNQKQEPDKPVYDPAELTKQKSVWDIYVLARHIPGTPFNNYSTLLITILLIAYVVMTDEPSGVLADRVRDWAGMGFQFSINVLGLLIAGFTIFATISDPELLYYMATVQKKLSDKVEINFLKHNFFLFMRVLIYFIGFALICLLIMLFASKGGFLSQLIEHLPDVEFTKSVLSKLGIVVLGTGFYFLLVVQLKSFIFNVYSAVMTSLRWKNKSKEEEYLASKNNQSDA